MSWHTHAPETIVVTLSTSEETSFTAKMERKLRKSTIAIAVASRLVRRQLTISVTLQGFFQRPIKYLKRQIIKGSTFTLISEDRAVRGCSFPEAVDSLCSCNWVIATSGNAQGGQGEGSFLRKPKQVTRSPGCRLIEDYLWNALIF